jgi:hypothetical protein
MHPTHSNPPPLSACKHPLSSSRCLRSFTDNGDHSETPPMHLFVSKGGPTRHSRGEHETLVLLSLSTRRVRVGCAGALTQRQCCAPPRPQGRPPRPSPPPAGRRVRAAPAAGPTRRRPRVPWCTTRAAGVTPGGATGAAAATTPRGTGRTARGRRRRRAPPPPPPPPRRASSLPHGRLDPRAASAVRTNTQAPLARPCTRTACRTTTSYGPGRAA